jgi:putative aldouronate transport system permease protein
MMNAADISRGFSQETIIYATIIVSIIPILLVYPFIQKYFVKGMMLGAVKE